LKRELRSTASRQEKTQEQNMKNFSATILKKRKHYQLRKKLQLKKKPQSLLQLKLYKKEARRKRRNP